MKKKPTLHLQEVVRLKKIEGQVRGVQKMIEEKRYCVDILTQLASIVGAIKSVEENILERHLKGCVHDSFTQSDEQDKADKIKEVISILKKMRK